jgi:hypothetical protein
LHLNRIELREILLAQEVEGSETNGVSNFLN